MSALKAGGVPRSLPAQADRVWTSSWFATGLVKAVKYSGGGWKHPNPHGAIADHESNRVPLDADEIALLQAQLSDHGLREQEGTARWGRPASLEPELWAASANRKEDGAWTDDGEVEELYEIARGSGAVRSSINAYGERVYEGMPTNRTQNKDVLRPRYGSGIPRIEVPTAWQVGEARLAEEAKWAAEQEEGNPATGPGGSELEQLYREMQISQAKYEEAVRAGNKALRQDPGSAKAEAYGDHLYAT